jgi:hypothetical protein
VATWREAQSKLANAQPEPDDLPAGVEPVKELPPDI